MDDDKEMTLEEMFGTQKCDAWNPGKLKPKIVRTKEENEKFLNVLKKLYGETESEV